MSPSLGSFPQQFIKTLWIKRQGSNSVQNNSSLDSIRDHLLIFIEHKIEFRGNGYDFIRLFSSSSIINKTCPPCHENAVDTCTSNRPQIHMEGGQDIQICYNLRGWLLLTICFNVELNSDSNVVKFQSNWFKFIETKNHSK